MCLPSIAEAVTSNGRARSWKGTSPQALRGAKGSSFSSSVILRISFYNNSEKKSLRVCDIKRKTIALQDFFFFTIVENRTEQIEEKFLFCKKLDKKTHTRHMRDSLDNSFTSEFDLNNMVAPTSFSAVSRPTGATAGLGAGSTIR